MVFVQCSSIVFIIQLYVVFLCYIDGLRGRADPTSCQEVAAVGSPDDLEHEDQYIQGRGESRV